MRFRLRMVVVRLFSECPLGWRVFIYQLLANPTSIKRRWHPFHFDLIEKVRLTSTFCKGTPNGVGAWSRYRYEGRRIRKALMVSKFFQKEVAFGRGRKRLLIFSHIPITPCTDTRLGSLKPRSSHPGTTTSRLHHDATEAMWKRQEAITNELCARVCEAMLRFLFCSSDSLVAYWLDGGMAASMFGLSPRRGRLCWRGWDYSTWWSAHSSCLKCRDKPALYQV